MIIEPFQKNLIQKSRMQINWYFINAGDDSFIPIICINKLI